MKIAYLLHWNAGPESGVFKKVLAQSRYWLDAGCRVGIFLLSGRQSEVTGAINVSDRPLFIRTYGGFRERFRRIGELVRDVADWAPDLVYHRYDLYYPAIEWLARHYPLVLEVNTDDLAEYHLGPRHRALYNRFTRGRLLRKALGTVYVTGELARMSHFSRYHRDCAVIPNGISLDAFSSLPVPNNDAARLVFIGTPGQPWHGVDKILDLARCQPNWNFDLVGPSAADLDCPSSNVVVHGPLDRQGHREVLQSADVAVGTLALHRIGMDEACPLKVREYLAHGLPSIIGYQDTDFPRSVPFLLQLPNTASNVSEHVEPIRTFVEQWKGQRIARGQIRHIDAGHKEEQRIAFFQDVLNKATRRVQRASSATSRY